MNPVLAIIGPIGWPELVDAVGTAYQELPREIRQNTVALTTDEIDANAADQAERDQQVIDDNVNWGQHDYWATPVEFLARNGGDCEDFALAKYYTLKAMGIHSKRLYLTYVKNLNRDDFHMVMSYFEVPGIKPLFLDNLINEIKPASQRKDLLTVYNVNDTELSRTMGERLGKSEQISLWKEFISRMPEGIK